MSTIEDAVTVTAKGRERAQQTPAVADTTFRCALALAITRLGMAITEFGARRVSTAHPAHHAYRSAVVTLRDRTRSMPWRGFVPTGDTITTTQTAWLIAGTLFLNVALYLLDLPHLPVFGLLSHHLPQFSIRFVEHTPAAYRGTH